MSDRKLEKYCAGYTSKPGMESPLPKKGDPLQNENENEGQSPIKMC